MLHCSVVCCVLLFWIGLVCVVLDWSGLDCIVLYRIVLLLYGFVLHVVLWGSRIVLDWIGFGLDSIILCWIGWDWIGLFRVVLYCVLLSCVVVYWVGLDCVGLDRIGLRRF